MRSVHPADGQPVKSTPAQHAVEWHIAQRYLLASRRHIAMNLDRIDDLLPWISPSAPPNAWRSYVGPVDGHHPDLKRLFHELALTICQFGGFVGRTSDGSLQLWKKDNSGVKAILDVMDRIRADRCLSGIDNGAELARRLAQYFINAPFATHRVAMLCELAAPSAQHILDGLLKRALTTNGAYHFDALHMLALAHAFPVSFGGDDPIYKKASLLLMTMEIALKQLGHCAVALTPPPADYRIPQILESLGVLQYSDTLDAKITTGHIFRHNDAAVRAVRVMTVIAMQHVKSRYEAQTGRAITVAELDARLYLLSRNSRLMSRPAVKPHMLVATPEF